jgi:hypothetical protein
MQVVTGFAGSHITGVKYREVQWIISLLNNYSENSLSNFRALTEEEVKTGLHVQPVH